MTVKIGCIVEGQGDVAAVPVLIRRIATKKNIVYYTNFTYGNGGIIWNKNLMSSLF